MNNFDFVVFDWKGTLAPKGGLKALREVNALKEVSKLSVFSQTPYEQFFNAYHKQKDLAAKLEKEKGVAITKTKVIENALDEIQITDPDTRSKIIETYYQVFNKLLGEAKHKMYPDAQKLLDTLISRQIPIALIRNSTLPLDEFQKTVDESGASQYFHVNKNIVMSGDSGVGKPHKEIFEACIKKCNMGHVKPERILFVGNETDVDVVGGKNVGWKTVLVRTTEKTSNGLADYEVDCLEEILSIL